MFIRHIPLVPLPSVMLVLLTLLLHYPSSQTDTVVCFYPVVMIYMPYSFLCVGLRKNLAALWECEFTDLTHLSEEILTAQLHTLQHITLTIPVQYKTTYVGLSSICRPKMCKNVFLPQSKDGQSDRLIHAW